MKQEMMLSTPIEKLGDFGYRVRIPHFPKGDYPGNCEASRLFLFEDGKLIGMPHVVGATVMALGAGRYIHWDQTLLFSTPDNTDPNSNGRSYHIVWDDDLHYREKARYFYNVLSEKMMRFQLNPSHLSGKRVLELGCGSYHGASLIAAGLGADVVSVDRFASPWDENKLRPFVEYLIGHGTEMWPSFNPSYLYPILEAKAFVQPPYRFYQIDAENLTNVVDDPFDVQISHAALEHFYDVKKVGRMLYQTAKSGSLGSHVVDMRDHRDFSKPLEFLLLSDSDYDALCGENKYIFGNRVRPSAFKSIWEECGFSDVAMTCYPHDISDAYLSDFIPRLRASRTRFADEPADTLQASSVSFAMIKR